MATFSAKLAEVRTVTAHGLVSLARQPVFGAFRPARCASAGTHRLGSASVRIATTTGSVMAAHLRAPDGAGRIVSDDGHVRTLE